MQVLDPEALKANLMCPRLAARVPPHLDILLTIAQIRAAKRCPKSTAAHSVRASRTAVQPLRRDPKHHCAGNDKGSHPSGLRAKAISSLSVIRGHPCQAQVFLLRAESRFLRRRRGSLLAPSSRFGVECAFEWQAGVGPKQIQFAVPPRDLVKVIDPPERSNVCSIFGPDST